MTCSAYEAAGVTEELNFVFLSKAALTLDDIRNFIVQRGPNTFKALEDAFLEYDQSCAMFKQMSEATPFAYILDMRKRTAQQYGRYATTSKGNKDVQSVDDVSSQLAKPLQFVKKQSMTSTGGCQKASNSSRLETFIGKECSYCG